jgi:uncharacterized membrane protein
MTKGRLEAFSDGVLAIVITIMVLEIKVPRGSNLADLQPLLPKLSSYLLSFVYLGIYWNNHHHLLHAVSRVNGRVLWANLHLLFWLSLVPISTGWMGENHFGAVPVALYGVVLLCAGTAYFILTRVLIAHHGATSVLATSVGSQKKEMLSILVLALSIPAAFVHPSIACAGYVMVAAMWIIPDRRLERAD